MHPNEVDLYAGIVGLQLDSEFKLYEGIVIRPTYAYVFTPSMIAFSPPLKPNSHHPTPYRSLEHGYGYDVLAELYLDSSIQPIYADRLNTVWWIAALIRLVTGAAIHVPALSSSPFEKGKSLDNEMKFWPIEMQHSRFVVPTVIISPDQLDWLQRHFLDSAVLMESANFSRAFQVFDSALWTQSLGSAILMMWAALETLMRPGRKETGKTLSRLLATFLYEAGTERDRMFAKIMAAYEARGGVAHNSEFPEQEEFTFIHKLGRAAFKKSIELRAQPISEELLESWKLRT